MDITISGVIIGGMIGILSSVITPIITYKQKERHEEKNKKLDRLERLVILINQEVDIWAEKISSNHFKNCTNDEPISPICEIKSIVEIFFKDLKPSLALFSMAMLTFRSFFSNYTLIRVSHKLNLENGKTDNGKNVLGLTETEEEKFRELYRLAYQNLISSKDDFLSKLIEAYSPREEKQNMPFFSKKRWRLITQSYAKISKKIKSK